MTAISEQATLDQSSFTESLPPVATAAQRVIVMRRKAKLREAKKRLGKLKYMETTASPLPLQDMSRDFFVLQARDWLDCKDVARLDSAMCSREGRLSLLEALRSGVVIYEGSKGEYDKLDSVCLRWLSLRGIGLRYLSVKDDVPSSLAFAVARNSPTLKCLFFLILKGRVESSCPKSGRLFFVALGLGLQKVDYLTQYSEFGDGNGTIQNGFSMRI
jgi:hypothetical protein